MTHKALILFLFTLVFSQAYCMESQNQQLADAVKKNELQPRPRLLIRKWENATPHEIEIYTMFPRKEVSTLKPGQIATLNQEVVPGVVPMGITYDIYAGLCAEARDYFQLDGIYYCGPKEVVNNPDLQNKIEFSISSTMRLPRDNPTAHLIFNVNPQTASQTLIALNVVMRGSRFEFSSIEHAQ